VSDNELFDLGKQFALNIVIISIFLMSRLIFVYGRVEKNKVWLTFHCMLRWGLSSGIFRTIVAIILRFLSFSAAKVQIISDSSHILRRKMGREG